MVPVIECIFLSQGRHYDSFPDFTPSSDASWSLTDSQQDDFSYFESPESAAEKSVEKRPSMTYDFLRFQNRMKYNHQTKTSMPDVSAQNDTKSEPEDYTAPRDGNKIEDMRKNYRQNSFHNKV